MRIDQDINFEVGGIPCRMRLETCAMGAGQADDLWIILPCNPADGRRAEEWALSHFEDAIDQLFEELFSSRDEVQGYDYQSDKDHAYLRVIQEDLSLADAIMAALPDWDGNSLEFFGSTRLIRLFANMKAADPAIRFTRRDGKPIDWEKFQPALA